MNSGIDNIRDRITQGLVISRVPKNTKKRFLEIANQDDFCSDYGNTLKFLIDFYDGIMINGTEVLNLELQQLRADVELLKSALIQKQEEKKRKMLNGKGVE